MDTAATPYSRLAGVYDELVVDPCFGEWADFLHGLWADDNVRSVLDVCCGTGLMTAELQGRGLTVVGVDASPQMLALARRRVGPDLLLIEAVLPDLPTTGTFDAAVSTFDGLNYLSADDLRASVIAIAGRLRPGGWLVFDLHTDATLAFARANPVITGEQDGAAFTLTTGIDDASRTIVTTIDLVAADPADSFVEHHRQVIHSEATVREALGAAGFDVIDVLDEYTPAPATSDTLRATWVARLGPPS